MSGSETRSVSVWPYVGYYTLTLVALTIAFGIILLSIPSLSKEFGKAAGFGINLGSTMVASHKFIRRNGRLFNRREYWTIVLLSSLAACLISAPLGLLAIAGEAGSHGSVPLTAWTGILLFAFLLVFAFNAAGYSSRFGSAVLKAELARRARTDSETFR